MKKINSIPAKTSTSIENKK